MTRWALLLLFAALTGCSGATKAVRLDTGRGKPLVHFPHRNVHPVKVGNGEFQQAVAKYARTVPTVERPLKAARRMLGVPEYSGWYRYERKSRRVVPLSPEHWLQVELLPAEAELNRLYLLWCGRTWGPPLKDCLNLLVDSPTLDDDGKYTLAMAIARSAVLGEMKEAFGQMANPEAIVASLTSAMTLYLMLWLLPEPVSKGVAGLITVGLVAYLGWEWVWRLIEGWDDLVKEVDRAATFEQIQSAGLKFAKVMGNKGAQALVMLATLAVGNTAAGMAAKMPLLPGATQAAVVAEAQLNIRFSAAALAEVESVALTSEGVLVTLAPNAVAMTARGGSNSRPGAAVTPPRAGGPGEWTQSGESMSEQARRYQAQVTGAPEGYVYRVKLGEKDVKFDGFDQGTLLETKATGYAQWITQKLEFFGNFEGRDQLLDQAKRQVRAARGTPIRWIVAEEKLAGALRKVFQGAGLPIEVVHVPLVP